MAGETREDRDLRAAAAGPLAYCSRLRAEIRRNHQLAGQDPGGRPPRLERLVAYIERHLFEETLGVKAACRAVGIADSSIAVDLRAYTRYTVDQLIARLRMEAAVHLVVRTQVKVTRLGTLVGFKTYSTFLRTYKIWTGETPEDTRRHALDPSIPFDFGSLAQLQRLGSGNLSSAEVGGLQESLVELYPQVPDTCREVPRAAGAGPALPAVDVEAFERFQAEEVWSKLTELPFAEQRELVRSWSFWTPAPFKFFRQKAREAGRQDRQRGLELARLALDCLEGNENRLGPRLHELRVEGCA